MIKTKQESANEFSQLLNKNVKVVYKEFNAVQIGRGMLVFIGREFLTLDGDFSIQTIPIASIIKISYLKTNREQDHDGNTTTRMD